MRWLEWTFWMLVAALFLESWGRVAISRWLTVGDRRERR